MNNRIAAGVLFWTIAVTVAIAAILPVRDATAEQTGSFTGILIPGVVCITLAVTFGFLLAPLVIKIFQ